MNNTDLRIANQTNNSQEVVNSIQKGIENSSHMLCIISPNNKNSKWVPFEIGYGYKDVNLLTLTLSGIENSDLPDYIKVAPIIRNVNQLNRFLYIYGNILHKSLNENYNSYHSLYNIMDF